MRTLALAFLVGGFCSSGTTFAADRSASIGIRAAQVKVGGDAENAKGNGLGVSVNIISPKAWDFAWGTHFSSTVDLTFGRFDYEGTDWPFADDEVQYSVLSIAPGITFFGNAPVQLQFGLPISRWRLDQESDADGDGDKEEFAQNYGSDAYVIRVGRLVSDDFTVSVEYEMHTLEQTVAGETSTLDLNMASVTVGWVPGD